ncbi:polysaccharide pyruvyl transferase family protein [Agrobacterium sp. NPDC090283]|uniref:polysaccharide pyruvyl transferase family protein n=1 Tax=Agrobacterium sp. NPDC090283 TaxID=3363920 RepID=UPI00383BBEFA
MRVLLFDTAVGSTNVGDDIIMDAIRQVIDELFPEAIKLSAATHDYLDSHGVALAKRSDLKFLCGSNILSSHVFKESTWLLRPYQAFRLRDVVAFGVGWKDYQEKATFVTKFTYNRIFSSRLLHSVRDEYSKKMLESIGIRSLNTGCPTMWRLTPERCASIPVLKAPAVVFATTFYRPNVEVDREIYLALKSKYEKIYFWPQQYEDIEYFQSWSNGDDEIIPPNLIHYNYVLDNLNVDFVGSRLHGGIRAMQRGRRSLILSVDNRAREIASDTHLPVLDRSEKERIVDWISSPTPVSLKLPVNEIQTWKDQFRSLNADAGNSSYFRITAR